MSSFVRFLLFNARATKVSQVFKGDAGLKIVNSTLRKVSECVRLSVPPACQILLIAAFMLL